MQKPTRSVLAEVNVLDAVLVDEPDIEVAEVDDKA